MLKAHEAEAAKHGAEFYNFGWHSGQNCICSKTEKGILETRIHPATMKVRHHWTSWGEYRWPSAFWPSARLRAEIECMQKVEIERRQKEEAQSKGDGTG